MATKAASVKLNGVIVAARNLMDCSSEIVQHVLHCSRAIVVGHLSLEILLIELHNDPYVTRLLLHFFPPEFPWTRHRLLYLICRYNKNKYSSLWNNVCSSFWYELNGCGRGNNLTTWNNLYLVRYSLNRRNFIYIKYLLRDFPNFNWIFRNHFTSVLIHWITML